MQALLSVPKRIDEKRRPNAFSAAAIAGAVFERRNSQH
jgi:hypothetical protein